MTTLSIALVTLLLCVCAQMSSALVQYPVTSPEIYHTPHNWRLTASGSLTTTNPGAYLKFGFAGGSLLIIIDTSVTPKTPYQTLRYIIDANTSAEDIGDIVLPSTSGSNIAIPIKTPGRHSALIVLRNSLQSVDRWFIPTYQLTIIAVSLDDGAVLFRPSLRPSTLLVYFDSIGEGVNTEPPGSSDLTNNDATHTWAFTLAESLNSEVSVVAYGRQGYSIVGNGDVAMLVNDTTEFGQQSAWSRYDATYSRLDAHGRLQYADIILCGHGTNDGLNPGVTNATKVYARRF